MARRAGLANTREHKSAISLDERAHPAVRVLAPLAICITTLIVFAPAVGYGFVDWDDDVLILQNPDMWGVTPARLKWMFTTTFMGHYQPLTWLSLAMNFDAGGTKASGYHLVNNLLHAASAVLVYWLSLVIFWRTLVGFSGGTRIGAAALAAMLFAVHPLRVESVVWVTERRDVLSAFFLLGGVLSYLHYAADCTKRRNWFVSSLVLVLLSLLSKAWGMTIPVVLLVLDVYPLGRVEESGRGRSIRRLVVEKVPFFVLSALTAGVALYAQLSSVGNYVPRGILYRMAQSFYGLAFYAVKTVLPLNLSPIYEHPVSLDPYSVWIAGAIAFVVIVTIVLFLLHRRYPALLSAWMSYAVIVSPVLGIVQAGPQFVANRYTYIASIPLVMLAAGGISMLIARARRTAIRTLVATGSFVLVTTLAVAARNEMEVWRDTESLWRTALRHDPDCRTALSGLGVICSRRQENDAAIGYLRRAHALAPDYAVITVNLAGAYAMAGRREESISSFRMATTQPSLSVNDLLNIGSGFAALGRHDEARNAFQMLVTREPKDGEGHYRLAEALDHLGRMDEAIVEYKTAVELLEGFVRDGLANPKVNVEAYLFELGTRRLIDVLNQKGDATGSTKYQEKLRLLRH